MKLRRIAFVLAAADTGLMIVNRLDIDATRRSAGIGVEILENGSYCLGESVGGAQFLAALKETRGDGVVVIDGGANIGAFTIHWANTMHGWGQIIAIEPQERVFYALCGNIALNNCSNARAFKAVLGRAAGEMDIPEFDYQKETNFGGVHMDRECDPGEKPCRTVKCKVMAIDDLHLTRLDYLKLDIEGMEPAALHGARQTIARCKPVIHVEHNICGIEAIKLHLHDYEVFMAGMNAVCIPRGDPILKMVRIDPAHAQQQSTVLKAS